MDYEKNYKDAFGLAKDWYNDATTSEKERRLLAAMFSELKESEDERIRKTLIHIVKGACDKYGIKYKGDDITEEKLLAYLERQKEQKPIISDDAIREGVAHFGITQYQINNWLKKHINIVEQQPAEIDEYEIIKKHITEDSLSSEVNKRLKECGWYVTYEKPAEWSEEDKEFIKDLCNLLAAIAKNNYVGCYYAPELINKIHSLRPQHQWKPSEEQMGALNYAYCELFKREDVGHNILGPLQKLIDELQKLL